MKSVCKNLDTGTIFTMMKNILYVFLGGGIGNALRYLVFLSMPSITFPYATFLVNICGSFLIGLFIALYSENPFHQSTLLFLATGICGGFTTFSAFSKESFGMIQAQQWGLLFAYILLSVSLSIGATALGFYVGK